MHHRYGVQIDLAALPDDPDVLRRMLREVVPELQAENEKLLLLIQRLLRHRFGPRSEKLDLDQLQLVLEEEEQGAAEDEAATEAVSTITVSDGSLIATFDGLPASASRVL